MAPHGPCPTRAWAIVWSRHVRVFDSSGLPELVLDGIDAAGGNPLALVEVADALTPPQLRGEQPLPSQLPLTEGVERVFLDRYHRLPEAAQTWLLVAAADDAGQTGTIGGRCCCPRRRRPGAAPGRTVRPRPGPDGRVELRRPAGPVRRLRRRDRPRTAPRAPGPPRTPWTRPTWTGARGTSRPRPTRPGARRGAVRGPAGPSAAAVRRGVGRVAGGAARPGPRARERGSRRRDQPASARRHRPAAGPHRVEHRLGSRRHRPGAARRPGRRGARPEPGPGDGDVRGGRAAGRVHARRVRRRRRSGPAAEPGHRRVPRRGRRPGVPLPRHAADPGPRDRGAHHGAVRVDPPRSCRARQRQLDLPW